MKRYFSLNNKNTIVAIAIMVIWGVINGSSFIMWLSVGEEIWCSWPIMLQFYVMEFACSCLLTLLFYLAISALERLKLRFVFHILALLLISLLFAMVMGWCHYGVKGVIWPEKWELLFTAHTAWYALSQLGILFGLASLYYLIDSWFKLKKEREKSLEAISLAHEARLQMLRYQLNPHFLFNALNSIRALIDDDKVKARQVVTELSEFLRYSLVHTRDGMVPLGKEIDAVNNFFDIQKIRFEEKLKIDLDIDPATRGVSIPCFLIHPLAENAVKYGMQTSPSPLQIIIQTRAVGEELEVKVSNTGHLTNGHDIQAQPSQKGTGTGMQNVKQRLQHVYGDDYTFSLTEKEGWVVAYIKVKMEAPE